MGDERLFIGGWAPLQFNNIRGVIRRKENYAIFIRAIQHFESVLDGEESDDFDYNEAYGQSRNASEYMSRTNTSYESMMSDSEYSVLGGIDHKIKMRYLKSQRIGIDEKSDDENKCKKMDGLIINKLCKQMMDVNVYRNEFPKYVNTMFQCIACRRNHIFINLADLKTNYLLFLCDQMLEIEQNGKIESKLEKIMLLKVKKESLTLDIWDKVHRKYNNKFSTQLWFKCISMFRYNFEKNLSVFFNEDAYKLHLRNQQETDGQSSGNNDRQQTDDALDATKSYRL